MEEGTGLGTYILVGVIIFGLFVTLAVGFGDGILVYSGKIINCVTSYVNQENGDCMGEDDTSKLPEEIGGVVTRFGPSKEEWVTLNNVERSNYVSETYVPVFTGNGDEVEYVTLQSLYGNISYGAPEGHIYGLYDAEGNLRETYTLGLYDLEDSDNYNIRSSTVTVNDERLIPDIVKKEGVKTTGSNSAQDFIRYTYVTDGGLTKHYKVAKRRTN